MGGAHCDDLRNLIGVPFRVKLVVRVVRGIVLRRSGARRTRVCRRIWRLWRRGGKQIGGIGNRLVKDVQETDLFFVNHGIRMTLVLFPLS